jgi:hypothetical protein
LVGAVAGILVLILFDFWPMEKLGQLVPVLNEQPWRGLVLSALVTLLVAAAWVSFVGLAHWDLVVFMVRVCVSAIFGIFIILILFKNLAVASADEGSSFVCQCRTAGSSHVRALPSRRNHAICFEKWGT